MLGELYYSSCILSLEPFALLPQVKKRHLYFRRNCVCVDVFSRQRVHAFYVYRRCLPAIVNDGRFTCFYIIHVP